MAYINESNLDRVIRVVLGALLLALGWGGLVSNVVGEIFKWLGFVPLLTGLIGWCPAYALLRIRTNKRA